jgi:asparagine synthase (glutamine-hydrolysing)
MFALAFHDGRRQTLLLARDRMGIKPLYFARRGGTVYFASELRAVLATDAIPRVLDPTGVSSYLWNGFVVGPGTMVKGVMQLDAGSFMELTSKGEILRQERFWSLPEPAAPSEQSTDRFKSSLAEAVRLRLVSDVDLGVFLSGGIDSSAVAAMAADADHRVKTFNISFDEVEFDESRFAEDVARQLGTDHHNIRLRSTQFRSQLEDALRAIDQPTVDAINTYFVSRAVREAGIRVALAGTGGDELLGGYRSFRDIPRALPVSRAASWVPDRLRRRMSRLVARARMGAAGEVGPPTRWGKLEDALSVEGDLLRMYQVSYGLFSRPFLRELAGDCVEYTLDGLPFVTAQRLRSLTRGGVLPAISRLELSLFLGERLLRDTDAASMAVSLEVRVPLVDHEVIEAASDLDPAVRYQPLGRKQLLRDMTMSHRGPEAFDRPKSGFELPLGRWSREELSPVVDELLSSVEHCQRVGLNPDAVGRLWRSFQAGAPGLYWSRIWGLFVLLWWSRENDVELHR